MAASSEGGRRLLFVSYDGVLGGPGRSQTVPYLLGYRAEGWDVRLLSFEKPDLLDDEARRLEVEELLAEAAIPWETLRWARSPLRDLAQGLRAVGRTVREFRPRVLHARSYVPALLCHLVGRKYGARLLFDMRGLWPDERVDGGLWSRSNPMYRLWIHLERRLLARADGVVTLTHTSRDLLRQEGLLAADKPTAVIPCGVDLELFRPGARTEVPTGMSAFRDTFNYAFLGATGTWYLLDRMLDFAADAIAADPDARLIFMTEDPASRILTGLEQRSVPVDRYLITRVPHREVPAWLNASAAGVFFTKACRSKMASCPTKLGEFLGCGVPVITNSGVGDMDSLVTPEVGVVLKSLDAESFAGAREEVARLLADPGSAGACRAVAESDLDVVAGAAEFSRLAEELAGLSR